jgi:hypothetical protein
VPILLRAESGFAREQLMSWCEKDRVDFVFGPTRNDRLAACRTGRHSRRGNGHIDAYVMFI